MDQSLSSTAGARRDQDIALDLLKFIASTTSLVRPGLPATGFTAAASAKPDDQISQLLELYSRCLGAVQAKPSADPEPGTSKGVAR